MNIDFDLAFLYYQEKAILDARDPKMEELDSHIKKFSVYLKTASIFDLIKLIVFAYKKKYGQEKYWYRKILILGSSKIDFSFLDNLDEEADLYAPKEIIDRDDIKHLILRRFDDVENNSLFLKELELAFISSQDRILLTQGIAEELSGLSFSRSDTAQESTFVVNDSPIASIRISTSKFILTINQDKWVRYFG
ncbi:hypothetical protein [Aquimarina sp. 2201CG14-23]|uniref:hypothetical protein n=1 Tax=Aquimarina mycalae TaxID=3040073 RepID=UPI002477CC2B|nr:hypothetical protein [Aquimarina sp. 2201CG14-23]MDH7447097.1 hypothetical protein [Aquimarina sp. 2201CG14-23]